MSLFCRHNRFVAECPICAKGTVLDPERRASRQPRPPSSGGGRAALRRPAAAATQSRGPYASAGPYDGREVRLERVPGGLRLASWRGGSLERGAPLLDAGDLAALVASALEKGLLPPPSEATGPPASAGSAPAYGRSPGRAGELRDELRVERLEADRVRFARWVMRPNRGWELQDAPVMLPPARFREALADAAARGLLPAGRPGP